MENNPIQSGDLQNNQKKEKKNRAFLISLIVLLVLLNAVILFMLHRQKTAVAEAGEDLIESVELRNQLEIQLRETELQLAEYMGRASDLDSMVMAKNAELQEKADEIRKLIEQGKITAAQYQKALNDIEGLRYYTRKYLAQIDSLDRVNQKLAQENVVLKETVKKERLRSDQIIDENVKLSNKVALGAQLSARNLEVTGVRLRRGGRERETNRSRNVDRLRMCFALDANIVADPGYRDVYVKIVTPQGSTLHMEQIGSGKFVVEGDESLYTMKQEINYENASQNYCMYFDKGSDFEPGDYVVELYTEGYLLGKTDIEIR